MKKIFSVLISLSIMLSVITTTSAETTNKYDENKWNLLFAIDVLDEIEIFDIADDKITKGEYMIYLINLFAKYDETYEGDSLYSDVVERDECYEAANIAKQMGCYPGLELKPRETIAYGEAVEILLRGMGYTEMLKTDSVINVANRADFPSMSISKTITMNDMVELFYSALHAPLCKYDISYGETVKYKIDDGKTILSEYYDIEIIEGLVTNNGTTSLYSTNSLLYPGIEIDEVFYGDINEIGRDYLGCKVRAYIDYTDAEDDGNLVYIMCRNTTITKIQSEDIEYVDSRVTRIDYEVNKKIKRSKISENTKVIYNGKFVEDYDATDIMPENGSVTLIDNNRDDIADVVIVWSYETIFIDYVSVGSKTVYNRYKATPTLTELCLDEYETDYDYEIFWDGDKTTFSELQKYQILSVARSKNEVDGYMRIELSKIQIKGKIEVINNDDEELKINGETYSMLPEFRKEYNNIKLSETYVLYIDSFGKVAAMMVDDKEIPFIYAYLFKAYMNEDGETGGIRVFTQEADWIRYDVTDKVVYNGKHVEPCELMAGVKNDADRSGLVVGGATNRQVIKLKTDGNNVVSVETAKTDAGIDEFSKHSEGIRYRMQDKSFDNRYFVNENTIIFGIPTDDPENLDAYRLRPSLTADKQYDITAYGIDEYGDVDVLTVGVSTFRKNIKTCLVIDIFKGLNADEEVSTMLKCSFGNFGNFDIVIDEALDYSSLNTGDIIDITINEVGEIISFTKKYNYATDAGKYYYPTTFHSDTYLYGRIMKIDPENERMIVNLGGDRTSQCLRLSYENLVIKKYNKKNRRSEIISALSLEVGDYIVVDNRASYTYEIIVYEDL